MHKCARHWFTQQNHFYTHARLCSVFGGLVDTLCPMNCYQRFKPSLLTCNRSSGDESIRRSHHWLIARKCSFCMTMRGFIWREWPGIAYGIHLSLRSLLHFPFHAEPPSWEIYRKWGRFTAGNNNLLCPQATWYLPPGNCKAGVHGKNYGCRWGLLWLVTVWQICFIYFSINKNWQNLFGYFVYALYSSVCIDISGL